MPACEYVQQQKKSKKKNQQGEIKECVDGRWPAGTAGDDDEIAMTDVTASDSRRSRLLLVVWSLLIRGNRIGAQVELGSRRMDSCNGFDHYSFEIELHATR